LYVLTQSALLVYTNRWNLKKERAMPDPLWRRIAEDLSRKIETGQLGGNGQPLPSEPELRKQYLASRNTIRGAVRWLAARGLVVTSPGRGTFVRQVIDPFVIQLSARLEAVLGGTDTVRAPGSDPGQPRESAPRIEIRPAPTLVARELDLDPSDTVVSRHQERFIGTAPWSLQTTFYPMRLVTQGATRLLQAADIRTGTLSYLEEALTLRHAGRRDRFSVRAPDQDEARFFALPDDGRVAVFEVAQTLFDESQAAFAITITTCPADRNHFVLTAGNAPAEPSAAR
jgi:DNA-binding GntR family transcriptional regulator